MERPDRRVASELSIVQRGVPPETGCFAVGQRVFIEAEIKESFPGDTCVRIETGDRSHKTSIWVPTGLIHRPR